MVHTGTWHAPSEHFTAIARVVQLPARSTCSKEICLALFECDWMWRFIKYHLCLFERSSPIQMFPVDLFFHMDMWNKSNMQYMGNSPSGVCRFSFRRTRTAAETKCNTLDSSSSRRQIVLTRRRKDETWTFVLSRTWWSFADIHSLTFAGTLPLLPPPKPHTLRPLLIAIATKPRRKESKGHKRLSISRAWSHSTHMAARTLHSRCNSHARANKRAADLVILFMRAQR